MKKRNVQRKKLRLKFNEGMNEGSRKIKKESRRKR